MAIQQPHRHILALRLKDVRNDIHTARRSIFMSTTSRLRVLGLSAIAAAAIGVWLVFVMSSGTRACSHYWVEYDIIGGWNYRSSIRTNSSLSAGATRQREHVEPPSPQRNSVRRRAWLQVAGLASEVWLLAHSLYPHEPLVQKRSPQSGVRTPSTRADSAHQYRGGFGGQHDCQGASRWHGRVKKTDRSPSASPGEDGPPRFIWLPQMLERL